VPYQFLESGSKKRKIDQGLFGFPSYPTSYLVDKKGKLVYAGFGHSDGDEGTHRRRILQFLKTDLKEASGEELAPVSPKLALKQSGPAGVCAPPVLNVFFEGCKPTTYRQDPAILIA